MCIKICKKVRPEYGYHGKQSWNDHPKVDIPVAGPAAVQAN